MYDELYIADGYTFYKLIYGLRSLSGKGYFILDKKKNTVDLRFQHTNGMSIINISLKDCKIKESASFGISFKKLANIIKVKSSNNKEFEFSFGPNDLTLSKVVKMYDLIKSRTDKTLKYDRNKDDHPIIGNLKKIEYFVDIVLDKWLITDFFDEFRYIGNTWDDFHYSSVQMHSFGEEMFFMSSNVNDSSADFVIKREQVYKFTNSSKTDQISVFSLRDIGILRDILPAINNSHRIECKLRSSHPFYAKIDLPSIKGVFEMWVVPSKNKGYYEDESNREIEYVGLE